MHPGFPDGACVVLMIGKWAVRDTRKPYFINIMPWIFD